MCVYLSLSISLSLYIYIYIYIYALQDLQGGPTQQQLEVFAHKMRRTNEWVSEQRDEPFHVIVGIVVIVVKVVIVGIVVIVVKVVIVAIVVIVVTRGYLHVI